MTSRMNRASAARYITEQLGQTVTKAALEKMAQRDEGPAYSIVLGQASYLRESIDAWLADLPRQPAKRGRRSVAHENQQAA